MKELFRAILVCCFLFVIKTQSYKILKRLNRHSINRGKNFQINVNYNPFSDDKNMISRVSTIKKALETVSTKMIRDELISLGIPCKSYLERSDLVTLLAETRILRETKTQQEFEENLRVNVERADKLDNEISIIKQMDKDALKRELYSYQIPFYTLSSDERYRILALARLNMTDYKKINQSENLFSSLNSIVQNASVAPTKIMGDTFSNGYSHVKKIASDYEWAGLTESEKNALLLIESGNFTGFKSSSHASNSPKSEEKSFSNDFGFQNKSQKFMDPDKTSHRQIHPVDDLNKAIFNSYYEKLKVVFSSLISDQTIELIKSVINYCIDNLIKLGKWSGGSDLIPSHVLFICSFVSIIWKKGVLAFFGVSLAIRLLRIAIHGKFSS